MGYVHFIHDSGFSLSNDSQRQLVWREVGPRFHPTNIMERNHWGGPAVLLWGGFMLSGRIEH